MAADADVMRPYEEEVEPLCRWNHFMAQQEQRLRSLKSRGRVPTDSTDEEDNDIKRQSATVIRQAIAELHRVGMAGLNQMLLPIVHGSTCTTPLCTLIDLGKDLATLWTADVRSRCQIRVLVDLCIAVCSATTSKACCSARSGCTALVEAEGLLWHVCWSAHKVHCSYALDYVLKRLPTIAILPVLGKFYPDPPGVTRGTRGDFLLATFPAKVLKMAWGCKHLFRHSLRVLRNVIQQLEAALAAEKPALHHAAMLICIDKVTKRCMKWGARDGSLTCRKFAAFAAIGDSLIALLAGYLQTATPWWPHLVFRDVLRTYVQYNAVSVEKRLALWPCVRQALASLDEGLCERALRMVQFCIVQGCDTSDMTHAVWSCVFGVRLQSHRALDDMGDGDSQSDGGDSGTCSGHGRVDEYYGRFQRLCATMEHLVVAVLQEIADHETAMQAEVALAQPRKSKRKSKKRAREVEDTSDDEDH
jgi:hypothetical protein